jgi:hypothetical protein
MNFPVIFWTSCCREKDFQWIEGQKCKILDEWVRKLMLYPAKLRGLTSIFPENH